MGIKQFNQDLAASKAIEINGVSGVRRGDSDGEVVFTWSLGDATPSLDIRILVLDVDSYPKSSSVMIFTESEHSLVNISSLLERLSAALANKDIQTIIEAVAERLLAKVEAGVEADGDAQSDADSDDAHDEEELDSEYDYLGDSSFLPPSSKPRPGQIGDTLLSSTRLKKNLQAVHSAGISVGIFPRRPLPEAEFFSLSLRVSKLGIPEHALEAWGLERHDYAVLLCRFPSHFPIISDLLTDDEWKPQFRFGKCSKPKPSIETARFALTAVFDASYEDQSTSNDKAQDTSDGFTTIYMSNSINMLLNHEFLTLLKIRRGEKVSWDGALSRLKMRTTGGDSQDTKPFDNDTPDTPVSEHAMPSLGHDYALDSDENFNLPMVAMQLALRHLVRCTKYCMVCHQRLEDEFEAIKPYVCHGPLCTYQFTTLGLGASIEHEIISNPYVVDILISFFAVALSDPKSLRNFPVGLNIKSIPMEDSAHTVSEACFLDRTFRFTADVHAKMDPRIKMGDLLMIVIEGSSDLPAQSLVNGHFERHICKVTDIVAYDYKFEILQTLTTPLNVLPLPESERPSEASNSQREWKKVLILQYTCDTDNLKDADRSMALAMVLRGIPSVLDMRAYLMNNSNHRLASWSRINKNALTLLQWIISSNRSLILQDDAVPNLVNPVKLPGGSQDMAPSNSNKVNGLSPQWMQFRFLQGTPERERHFMKEIMTVSQSEGEQSEFPTIFAWHGSGLQNWHSIIRTGLDFDTVQNGRAYGNGVYMSHNFDVSMGYCRRRQFSVETRWQNSLLNPSAAISICEVVNRCDEFVKVTPHYVVNQIEWIQCRYLFVDVDPTPRATQEPFPTKPKEFCTGYVRQQPSRSLCASGGVTVNIPLSALPSSRRHLGQNSQTANGFESTKATIMAAVAFDSDHDETDHELLLESDEEDAVEVTWRSNKRRSSSIETSDKRNYKLSSAEYAQKMPEADSIVRFTTDFVPGSLDLESLPKLPEPSWASTSPIALKSLNRAIKELHEIQLHENMASLGWYIDFEKISNVFHWTVELHSFDLDLPLAQDMKAKGCTSVVLEFRFGANFPFSPPFVRIIRPRFLPFHQGGGGHVTLGGAICSEMLTNSGWSAALTIEKVLLQIRLGLEDLERPARLDPKTGVNGSRDYGIGEAVSAFQRAATSHGWRIPDDLAAIGNAWVPDTA
ncbi:hypothetical protein V8C35DRAFT_323206 [Trichoderma chlorosporum]